MNEKIGKYRHRAYAEHAAEKELALSVSAPASCLNVCVFSMQVRPAILHRYGGVYADMDQEALKPLHELLEGKQMVLAQMGKNNLNSIPNAFMAAVEGHRFLQQFMRSIKHVSSFSDRGVSCTSAATISFWKTRSVRDCVTGRRRSLGIHTHPLRSSRAPSR